MAHACLDHPELSCPECEVENEVWEDSLKAERQEIEEDTRRTTCPKCGEALDKRWPEGWCPSCEKAHLDEISGGQWLGIACGILLLCLPAFGQTTYKAGKYTGAANYGVQGQGAAGTGENVYCPAGTGEMTEGTPTWGTADGVVQLPTRCMNTAQSSTPSPGYSHSPATTADLSTLLSGGNLNGHALACGDTIILAAGQTYTGPFTFPNKACDGGHWITVRTSEIGNANFPAEGTRATPCIAGIWNDATHGRNNPGYPDYACPSYPAVLTAKIVTDNGAAIMFETLAGHYRFIGIEVTKVPDTRGGGLVATFLDPVTMGANHIIFDRSIIHGQPWTLTNSNTSETQGGVRAKNSQWVAVINSWIFDTYCISSCIDSQAFAAGSGLYQDGPFKIYNSLLASGAETYLFGGGGQGAAGTPVPKDIEFRANYSMKPLVWMVPIETCGLTPAGDPGYNKIITKNLGEFKNGSYVLIEGNYFANSWQGCQSDQQGYALLVGAANQNNHQPMKVVFDGTTNVVTAVAPDEFSFSNGTPGDATYCPVGGCILEINDASRNDDNVEYRFCNGTNGCTQDGMDQITQARITAAVPPAAGTVQVNSCVPGDCPTCRARNITMRYNEIFNVTNGIGINSGKSSVCHDEAAGNDHTAFHDNLIHGCSVDMGNGSDPYSQCLSHSVSSNTENPITFIEISHETVAIENGGGGGGGFGQQIDRTDLKYLAGLNIHDNVAPAPWAIGFGTGGMATHGVGDAYGLANVHQIDACKAYYPVEAPGGIVPDAQRSAFTFSPSLSNYFVTVNAKYRALASSTTTGFTLSSAAVTDDTITVRDLNTCDWTFRGNLLGTDLPGSGVDFAPYPATNSTNCGTSGTAPCILATTDFTNLFGNWGTGRTGDFHLTGSNAAAYLNSASDAASRAATGKNPGADLTVLAQLTSGVSGIVFYPSLSMTTPALSASVDIPYQGVLSASGGASPYKGWWLETAAANCGGDCGTLAPGVVIGRGGTVNGPFAILTVALTNNVAKITLKQTIVAGANSWTAGQKVRLQNFCVDPAHPCTGTQAADAVFNGTFSVVASGANCTNSINVVCLSLTNADINSHQPDSRGTNNPAGTFAPTTPGTFTWWMGARDGAFQVARGPVTLTVTSQQGHSIDLNWNASASSGQGGCCTYRVYRSTTSESYGGSAIASVSGTTFTDTDVSAGAIYYYVVTAFDGSVESGVSNEAMAVVP